MQLDDPAIYSPAETLGPGRVILPDRRA